VLHENIEEVCKLTLCKKSRILHDPYITAWCIFVWQIMQITAGAGRRRNSLLQITINAAVLLVQILADQPLFLQHPLHLLILRT